jgi:hypothetical protein
MEISYSGFLDLHPNDQKTRFLPFSIGSIILAVEETKK